MFQAERQENIKWSCFEIKKIITKLQLIPCTVLSKIYYRKHTKKYEVSILFMEKGLLFFYGENLQKINMKNLHKGFNVCKYWKWKNKIPLLEKKNHLFYIYKQLKGGQ